MVKQKARGQFMSEAAIVRKAIYAYLGLYTSPGTE